jgi:2-amino-4-hydroxy-6-hydroxymethyldihydropteridine diphosphokinase
MVEASRAAPFRYLIALGSNRPLARGLGPAAILTQALAQLGQILAASPIIMTAPLGPSRRRYANAAAVIASDLAPAVLLGRLQRIERGFGRRRRRRWGERTLDLDIILWSGGRYWSRSLAIPHPAFRVRRFVLDPAARIAPRWHDPATGRTLAQLAARARRPKPVDPTRALP